MSGPERTMVGAWLDRPLGMTGSLTIVALICAAPAWLMADAFDGFYLRGDDFFYLAQSRTWPRLVENLWVPFNSHVVPLFRLGTWALIGIAGNLANLPRVFAVASYGVLVLVILAGGLLVARETGNVPLGLAAMAALGTTAVVEPAVTWYAASQTLWAGLGILAMLLALQGSRDATESARLGWLALAALAALASAALWSGGYVAGPIGVAYLWADGRSRSRKAAAVPLLSSVAIVVLVFAFKGREVLAPDRFHDRTLAAAANPIRGLLYTAQAIPEALILGNLGLVAATDAFQGVAFCLTLAGLWAWSRGPGRLRPNPLEAAGSVLVVLSLALVYTFRSYLPFDSLRSIGWYHAIPQIGAVLFAAGWWSGRFPRRDTEGVSLGFGGALGILVLVVFLLVVQRPSAVRFLLGTVPPLSASERKRTPLIRLQRLRAIYLASVRAERQHQFLVRLDRAEQICLAQGISRDAIHAALGRVAGPDLPEKPPEFDATDLLELPTSESPADPARVQSLLGEWLSPLPEFRPPWLPSDEPWPPK